MKDNKTLLAQANHYINPSSGGIVPPIDPSVTFARDDDLELIGNYVYGRYANPPMSSLKGSSVNWKAGIKRYFLHRVLQPSLQCLRPSTWVSIS